MNRRTLLLAPLVTAGCSRRDARVVLYSAQDREFADGLLADFTHEAGLAAAEYDTEANTSSRTPRRW